MSFHAELRLDLGSGSPLGLVRHEIENIETVLDFTLDVELVLWNAKSTRPAAVSLGALERRDRRQLLDSPGVSSHNPSVVELRDLTYRNPLTIHFTGVADILPKALQAFATIPSTIRAAKAKAQLAEAEAALLWSKAERDSLKTEHLRAKYARDETVRQLVVTELERALGTEGERIPRSQLEARVNPEVVAAVKDLVFHDLQVDVRIEHN